MRIAFGFLVVTLLSACTGGGSAQPPFPVESAYDTAVIQHTNNACILTVTVHRDRTAQSTSSCTNFNSTRTTLPPIIVSQLFSDVQAAQPVNALLACPTVDISTTIAWNNQQSPNIGTCTGTSTAEQNLAYDIQIVITSFTPLP